MAATINDRDNLIMAGARKQAVVLPDDVGVSGDVTGTLNGVPVQQVIDWAQEGGDGDNTIEILQNSGTMITVNSSTLFAMPGSGSGGTFIGGGGIFGRNSAGVTKFSVNSQTGLLEAEDATIRGTLTAGSVITNSVTISGSGTTLQQLVDSMGSTFDLQGALDAGVSNILAGVGSNYRLHVDTANAFVALKHANAVYNGTGPSGQGNLPAVGISAAGIAMGHNRNSDGAWVNSVAIDANGNASFAGTVAAGSVITNSVTISGSGTTLQQLVDGMGSTFDLQGALDAGVSNILAGVGSNYRLHVDTANAFVALKHANAVYNGTGPSGQGNLPAVGISAAGIAMGHNRNSDGAWVNSVAIDANGNASFAGTVAAGSVITNSVTISGSGTTLQQLVDGMGGTFDLQAALDTGVSNIIAGVGSNYRLDVDTANGLAVFKHVNAVYKGNAGSGGGVRPALGISSAGIAMGYNNNAGAWIDAVAISATGDATFAGTIAANSIIVNSATVDGVTMGTIRTNAATGASHVSATGNVHNVALSQISGDLGDIANGSGFVKTTANQATGGGRAFAALDSSNDYVRSLVSTKLTVVGSNPSTGWVGDSNGIRLYQGGVLKTNLPVSGNPTFSGDITGGANINITGQGTFKGQTLAGGNYYAGVFNPDGLSNRGGLFSASNSALIPGIFVIHSGNGRAVVGSAVGGSSSTGVFGDSLSSGGRGVEGVNNTSGGIGVRAASTNGTALQVAGTATVSSNLTVSGTTTINAMTKVGTGMVTNLNAQRWNSFQIGSVTSGSRNANFTSNNKPGTTDSGNGWLVLTTPAGTPLYIPAWT